MRHSCRHLGWRGVPLVLSLCCAPRGEPPAEPLALPQQASAASGPRAGANRREGAEAADESRARPTAVGGEASPIDQALCEQYSYAGWNDSRRFKCSICEPQALEPKCPTARPCVHRSSTPILFRNGWQHFWRIINMPHEDHPCTNGPAPADELKVVLAAEGLTEVDISCTLVDWVPALVGAGESWKNLRIKPDRALAKPPTISPEQVDEALYRARARFSEEQARWLRRSPHEPVFSNAEREKMVGSTFLQPTLRVIEDNEERGVDGATRTRIFVLYSPESSKVYVLDGSYERSSFDAPGGTIEFERKQASILVPWLRSMAIKNVRFPVSSACLIPDELGGRHWYHVSFAAKK